MNLLPHLPIYPFTHLPIYPFTHLPIYPFTDMGDRQQNGKVYLVGAGPGDPGLLTLKGCEALKGCDVVIYDALINPALLDYAPAGAERIFVGRPHEQDRLSQDDVQHLMIERAKQGKVVVRLKGGDPFIFGRGGEEAVALAEAGVAWELVPGVSAGHAVPGYAGIPLTHRDFASSVAFVTGHQCADPHSAVDWEKLATIDTLIIFMCVKNLPQIVAALLNAGRAPSTPMAVIERGTYQHQRVRVATLGTILDTLAQEPIHSPALTVIGDVVSLHAQLNWFEPEDRASRGDILGKGTTPSPSTPFASTEENVKDQGLIPSAPSAFAASPKYYPAFLDLRHRQVLVVGGGQVAERKVTKLLESGAEVSVVSPTLTPTLSTFAHQRQITYRRGEFEETDLNGAWLVIGATDDAQVNQRVAQAAAQRRLFCNIVDVPSLCSFLAPAIVARGDVQIAVSTSGRSPALAQRLKREIASLVGPEYEQLANLMSRWRPEVMAEIATQPERAETFHRLVESDILDLLRAGRLADAEQRAGELVQQLITRPDGHGPTLLIAECGMQIAD
jgi:uroporphyrin-III C-methyltransferase